MSGTPVAMADGSYKPIEQIKPGDLVLSRDTTGGTGQTLGKRVLSTSVRDVEGTLLLTFAGGATIEATGNHPFFVPGAGFVEADQLGIGSEIVTRAGPNLVVSKIEKKSNTVAVYNFVVADFHSYFVGDPTATGGGAWVHNGPGDCDLVGFRRIHILNRHRAGMGLSGKTEFPASWTDDEIMEHISDVATDPNSTWGVGRWNSPYAVGSRRGVDIQVDFYPPSHPIYSGKISTAYPINVAPNP